MIEISNETAAAIVRSAEVLAPLHWHRDTTDKQRNALRQLKRAAERIKKATTKRIETKSRITGRTVRFANYLLNDENRAH